MSDQWLDAAKLVIENAWYKASTNASFFSKLKSISKVYRDFLLSKGPILQGGRRIC